LSQLGRDLKKTIIIDNVSDNFQLQKENGIRISNFEGSENDYELHIMRIELLNIAKNIKNNTSSCFSENLVDYVEYLNTNLISFRNNN